MSVAALATMGRLRPAFGPALGRTPFPVTATVFSACLHVGLALAIVLGARVWAAHQPKMYIVNLVPAIAAVGTPRGEASAPPPTLPPREPERTRPAPPPELPQREATRARVPELPVRARDRALPERALPERRLLNPALADRALSERLLPEHALAVPRPGDKEMPTIASRVVPRDVTTVSPSRAAAPPPAPLGQLTGTPQGSAPVTLNVTDFPYAWYMSAIARKVTERWMDRALQGRQPVAFVEIARDGHVARLAIEKSSGNPYYDQAALRAITESNPFPPLPADYKEPILRVHFGFNFSPDRG